LLPKTFAPWQATYKAFSRWTAAGVFETLPDQLAAATRGLGRVACRRGL
jgi:transposase